MPDFLEAEECLATDRSFALEKIAEEMQRSEEAIESEEEELANEEILRFEEAHEALKFRQK